MRADAYGVPLHPLFDIPLAERAELRALSPGQAVAVAAAARDGVLTRAQLRAIGLSEAAIGRRIAGRLLFPRHRGVYAVGRLDLAPRGRLRAALLRCGRTAALSHDTSAAQRELLSARWRISITVTGTPRRPESCSGIDVHLTRAWRLGDVVWIGGLPCTGVARTLADLAASPDPRDFKRAWNRADQRLLLDDGALGAEVARGRTGAGVLRHRLANRVEAPPTESELEDMFLDLCDASGLRRPIAQWPLAVENRKGRVDFVYLPERLALELDGRVWHAVQDAVVADRAKDLALREAGFEPHRYSYWQIRDEGPRVAAIIARALAMRGAARRSAR